MRIEIQAYILRRNRVVHILAGKLQGLSIDGLEGAGRVLELLRWRQAADAAAAAHNAAA